MLVAIRLTDAQATVLAAASAPGADGLAQLVAAAIAQDLAAGPEPRWERPRPHTAGDPASAARTGETLLCETLPAASAAALTLRAGRRLLIEQLGDGQGVDVRAFTSAGQSFSAAETRAEHGTAPSTGAQLLTAPGRPLLTIVDDTAPGHDLLFPPCCAAAYELATGLGGHRGCQELLREALAGLALDDPPGAAGDDVLNLWLPTAVRPDGTLRWWPARARAGDGVVLRADQNAVVALSTCPDDMFGTSQYEPKPVRVTVLGNPGDSGDRPPVTSPWPTRPPPAARSHRHLEVALGDDGLAHLDRLAAGGWLGDDRPAVLRALLLRHVAQA